MSFSILDNTLGKEAATPASPRLLVQITCKDGHVVRFSSAADKGQTYLTYGGNQYETRLMNTESGVIQAVSPAGYDIVPSFDLTIADADAFIWTNDIVPHGWRGATMVVTFTMYDVPSATFATDSWQWRFLLGKPAWKRGVITVDSTSKMNMGQVKMPSVPVSRRCPWTFPQNATQRASALNDPTSIYYQCGYSADQGGGCGNTGPASHIDAFGTVITDASGNYVSCDYTRSSGPTKTDTTVGCMARLGNYSGSLAQDGDITKDQAGHTTGRFGGTTYIPAQQFNGRQYTTGQKVFGFNADNSAIFNGYDNFVYGAQWVDCTATTRNALGDPNSLRGESVVCVAANGAILINTVLVNGVTVPQFTAGSDVLFCWRFINAGGRNGAVNGDALYNSQGDCYGSLATIEWVVPYQLAAGGSRPSVLVLVTQAPPVAVISPAGGGAFTATFTASTNPVWHLLDLLTWGNWTYNLTNALLGDIDLASFVAAAAVCDTSISYLNLNGVSATHAQFRSSFALLGSQRQTLAQIVLGLRNSANLMLGPNSTTGLLGLFVRQALADQQPLSIAGSNSTTPIVSVTANANATLSSGINSSVTTIPLSYAMLTVANQIIQIDSEQMQITGGAGTNSLTVTRAFGATTAATHSSAAVVSPCGYLAYLFQDGNGTIIKDSFETTPRPASDIPNRLSFDFQDEDNQWQQDTISQIDPDAFVSSGNVPIDVQAQVIAIPNFDQGQRIANVQLGESLRGNPRDDADGTEYIKFESSVKAAHLASMMGAICGFDWQQLGI